MAITEPTPRGPGRPRGDDLHRRGWRDGAERRALRRLGADVVVHDYLVGPRLRVGITGASGLVGSALPEIKHVAHTNFCDIGWRVDPSGRDYTATAGEALPADLGRRFTQRRSLRNAVGRRRM